MNIQKSNQPNIWAIQSGMGGAKWELFKDKNIVAASLYDINRNYQINPLTQDDKYNETQIRDINYFVKEIQNDDIVIAFFPSYNKPIKVYGIGQIKSEYIPPDAENNPSEDESYRHVHHVHWLINEPIIDCDLILPTYNQGGGAVRKLDVLQFEPIKNEYLKHFPMLQEKINSILDFSQMGAILTSKNIENLLMVSKNQKNSILYGSPGTGKTYTVSQFAKLFLSEQLKSPITPEQLKLDAIKDLTWHDAISLAIYVNFQSKSLFKVTELVNNDLMQLYWSTTKTEKLSNTIHYTLQTHTDPSIETVKIAKRQLPYLFEKDRDGFWFLTDLGKEYVEENLAKQLKKLQGSTIINGEHLN